MVDKKVCSALAPALTLINVGMETSLPISVYQDKIIVTIFWEILLILFLSVRSKYIYQSSIHWVVVGVEELAGRIFPASYQKGVVSQQKLTNVMAMGGSGETLGGHLQALRCFFHGLK